MPTLNYTTTVPAERTIGQIQTLLARHGAASIAMHYENGLPSGLSFTLVTPHGSRAFTLPVDVNAVHELLQRQAKQRRIRPGLAERPHAERVAWRVLKDWIDAQLAIIEAQMATLDQVMLPYLHVDDQQTLYQVYAEREQVALMAGRV